MVTSLSGARNKTCIVSTEVSPGVMCTSRKKEKHTDRLWSVNDEAEINEKEVLEESEKNKHQQTSFKSNSEEDDNINTIPQETVAFKDLIDKVQHQEETLETKSRIMFHQGSPSPEINPTHIKFQPKSNKESGDKFKTLLLQELEFRGMLPETIESREEIREHGSRKDLPLTSTCGLWRASAVLISKY
eukprot:scaffold21733_cov53-Attheya_sp.AAC.5